MKILAVETSTLTGGIAVLSDDRLVGETTLSVSAQHSERLMPAVERLLLEANVSLGDIDLYAVASGPGSFTGLRIGIAAMHALSFAHRKPLVGVSTLEALARNGLYFPGVIVPMINAFRNEVYWGIYRSKGEGLECLLEDRVSGIEELIQELEKRTKEGVLSLGNGVDCYGSQMIPAFGKERLHRVPAYLDTPRASHVAFLAAQRHSQGLLDEASVLPRYLRRPG